MIYGVDCSLNSSEGKDLGKDSDTVTTRLGTEVISIPVILTNSTFSLRFSPISIRISPSVS